MHYKRQLWAWLTAMVLCFVIAAVLGSCSSVGDDKGTGVGGGDDAGTDAPTTTIAQVADKLIGCGFSGRDALVHRLELDFSVANKQADGVVFPATAKSYFEKIASAYLTCLVAAPCAELAATFCEGAASEGDTLTPCFMAADSKYASQAPGATFKCSDGTALDDAVKAVCNGINDCADKSDETSKACALVAHVECDSKSVPQVWRCNDGKQCTDGADEANCFVCSESEVTGSANRCNGREDCGSGADEKDCTDTFACPATSADAGADAGSSIDAGDGGGDAGSSIDAGDAGHLSDGGRG